MAEDARVSHNSVYFHELGVDDRIVKAISKLGWSSPTLIQQRAIPLALSGKDILARARTGSGKTAAYIIPILQRLLLSKQTVLVQEIKALVLAPSKELCKQIHKNFLELSLCCSRDISCVDISASAHVNVQRTVLLEKPDVVISTPSRVLEHIRAESMSLDKTLEVLVVDEADLLFAFGFEKDTKAVLSYLPTIYQTILMSATLNADVNALKKLVLHNPVILKLEEPDLPDTSQLTQYHIKCEEEEKFILIYALFKLNLIQGRTIIFVSCVDRCYRMKLYLEQFGIKSCVLNAELPVNSRLHIVSEFNDGRYDIIIASDEQSLDEKIEPVAVASTSKTKKKQPQDKESGIARGIDFHSVSNIINFDFPPDVDTYIHRVGRTARGTKKGTALSFVNKKENRVMEAIERTFASHVACTETKSIFKPYNVKMEELESFRYRAKDANRSVTAIAIKEARLKEIKRQLLTSKELKPYFGENPKDFHVLRHDKRLLTAKLKGHLKDVPSYIVPETLQKVIGSQLQQPVKKLKKGFKKKGLSKVQLKNWKKNANPLKSFKFSGFKKAKYRK